jgi:hypothetical protein
MLRHKSEKREIKFVATIKKIRYPQHKGPPSNRVNYFDKIKEVVEIKFTFYIILLNCGGAVSGGLHMRIYTIMILLLRELCSLNNDIYVHVVVPVSEVSRKKL